MAKRYPTIPQVLKNSLTDLRLDFQATSSEFSRALYLQPDVEVLRKCVKRRTKITLYLPEQTELALILQFIGLVYPPPSTIEPHYKLFEYYLDTVQSSFCRAFIFLQGGILTAKLGGFL